MLSFQQTFCVVHAEGEKLTSGELEEFIRQVIASGTLQEVGSEVSSQQPKEMLRSAMSLSATAIDKFLQDLSEGRYDSPQPKLKVTKLPKFKALATPPKATPTTTPLV